MRYLLVLTLAAAAASASEAGWPRAGRESRPWAYWWWQGSAVDAGNLTREMERYRQAGMGGLHIVPIYGTKGAEGRYLEYLGPRWMAMLEHAVKEGARLDLGVDMTTGTGWCFGGPGVSTLQAAGVAAPKRDPSGAWQVEMRPGIRVKRAAPGGEGFMLNPFFRPAVEDYLARFSQAFPARPPVAPRAMYHDSFEYQVNWSPDLPVEFARRRGYALEREYDALFGNDASDRAARVKGDYRETLSEMLRENLLEPWTRWAHARGIKTRNQAHGSPGNLLDLYAAADIPETEMFNKDRSTLVSKMASSAAHVSGKPLVAAETGTWLKEHFQETLGDLKELADQLFLAGVNHVFYHGTCYSPDDAQWPGWLFYASTQMNPRNPMWRDAPALNAYVERVQSMLQASRPDMDILLYWPIHDAWHDARGMTIPMTVHGRGWIEGQGVGRLAARLYERGYAFDFVSDRQLETLSAAGKRVRSPGGSYTAIVVPRCQHMPVATMRRLKDLARAGATVIFEEKLPEDVPGLKDLDQRRAGLRALTGGGGLIVAREVEAALDRAGAGREEMVDTAGLQVLRKRSAAGVEYFIANRGQTGVDGWVKLRRSGAQAVLLDPMTGRIGVGMSRKSKAGMEVYLQLEPGETVFVRLGDGGRTMWPYRRQTGIEVEIKGSWAVRFVAGGPETPAEARLAELRSWTRFAGEAGERFGGTALYSVRFDSPWREARLDLGVVRESARVRVNGADAGVVFSSPYRLRVEGLKPQGNLLEVEVSNLAANRIRDLDRRKVEWRIFRDINLVNLDYKPFDASGWALREAGLLGPVKLLEVTPVTPSR